MQNSYQQNKHANKQTAQKGTVIGLNAVFWHAISTFLSCRHIRMYLLYSN